MVRNMMRTHKLLVVFVCMLVGLMLAMCCLCSIIAGGMLFTRQGVAHTTSQPVSPYIAIARQDAIEAGISPDLFVRQINRESGFDPQALSPAGAQGIAQFMPKHWPATMLALVQSNMRSIYAARRAG
jgi:soluble lytic murein transglycosylase-like protein